MPSPPWSMERAPPVSMLDRRTHRSLPARRILTHDQSFLALLDIGSIDAMHHRMTRIILATQPASVHVVGLWSAEHITRVRNDRMAYVIVDGHRRERSRARYRSQATAAKPRA